MLLKGLSQGPGAADVSVLGPFVATRQKNHEALSLLFKVHAIPGPIIDSHLTDAATDGFDIARQPERQAIDSDLNPGACLPVTQTGEPFRKYGCLPDFDHSAFDRIL